MKQHLRQTAHALAALAREHLWDLIAGGLLVLATGLYMAWPPLEFIVVGGCGVALGCFGAKLTVR
jgi:hypothetical protein